MSFGFIKHIYTYFKPDRIFIPSTNQEVKGGSGLSLQGYVPIYDPQGLEFFLLNYLQQLKVISGRIEGYMRPLVPGISLPNQPFNHPLQTQADSHISAQPAEPTLYLRTTDGHFEPVKSETSHPPVSQPSLQSNMVPISSQVPWDGWPNGIFHRDFTLEEFKETDNLKIHWANRGTGGDRTGNEHVLTWEKGKKATRHCLGVFVCDNDDCEHITRPKTTSLEKQLDEPCKCTAQLHHQPCGVKSISWRWSKGVHFYNDGFHSHGRAGRVIHLLNDDRTQFETLVKAHPNTGSLGLIVGIPGINGPGKSVADISPVFLNAGRVSKEKQKIKHDADIGGNSFIASFAKFTDEHPGFVIYSTLGKVTVISVQSKFMKSNFVKKSRMDGPINGLVNDAAHGWWKERNSLLMVSSTYCPTLFCWVPGVFSYTNGASAHHFKYHFLAVLQSMAHEAEERKIMVVDAMFAGVMDFSEAERSGFILAFIEFWTLQPDDKRTPEELQEAAEKLLKGCQENFRAGVTHISRIGAIVAPDKADTFKARALGLLHAPNSEEFVVQATLLVHDFSKLKSWMQWWMQPSHAAMLFDSERKMDIVIWVSLPDTNNAKEAMHWKLYCAAGCNHVFMEGLKALYAVAAYYQHQFEATLKGIPIRYGQAEAWKVTAANLGHTKHSRAQGAETKKHKKNDGRPPDTSKELLGSGKQKKVTAPKTPHAVAKKSTVILKPVARSKGKITKSSISFGPPSYPWSGNSCWLDTHLELLFVCAMRKFEDFSSLFGTVVPPDSGLYALFTVLNLRMLIDEDAEDAKVKGALKKHRDDFRRLLKNKGVINQITKIQSLSGWLYHILRSQEFLPGSIPVLSYFYGWHFDLHQCTGSPEIGGAHVEIVQLHRKTEHYVTDELHARYNGCFKDFFVDLIAINKVPTPAETCWRSKDGEPLCPGKRVSFKELIISLPIILGIEVDSNTKNTWDFPETLSLLLGEPPKDNRRLVYDLVGFALFNPASSHFIARYTTRHGFVYTYDGLTRGGTPVQEIGATYDTHLSKEMANIPAGYLVHRVIYHLRGGRKAQNDFFNLRLEVLSKYFDVNFIQPDLNELPKVSYNSDDLRLLDPEDCRAWTMSTKTIVYVAKGLNDRPAMAMELDSKNSDTETSLDLDPLAKSLSPLPSIPDSLFALDCRCGMSGDGNTLYRKEDGEAIQCNDCRGWSHIACQKHGRADRLGKKDTYFLPI